MNAKRETGTTRSLDAAAEAGVVLLILLAPLPFGSVQPLGMLGVAAVCALCAALVFLRPSPPSLPLQTPWIAAATGLFFAIAALQIVPLPAALARLVSPAGAALRASIPGGPDAGAVALSLHPGLSSETLARLLAFGALAFSAAALATRPGAHRRILAAVFATGVFQAAYGSVEYLSGHQHIFSYQKRYYTDTATGTYINQNHFAGALELSLLVGLGFMLARLRSAPRGRRPASWRRTLVDLFDGETSRTMAVATLLAVVALGLLLSYSRSGIAFAALASCLVLAIDMRVHRDRRRGIPAFALAAGVLVLVSLVGWGRYVSDLLRQMGGIGLEGGRARVWLDSLAIVRDYPILGTGLGTFRDVYPLYRHESVHLFYEYAHNDYLQMLVETGLAGSAVLAALLALSCRAAWRSLARCRRTDFPLLLGAAGGLASILLHEATDFNLQIPANAVLFAAVAGALAGGLASACAEGDDSVIPFGIRPRRRRSPS